MCLWYTVLCKECNNKTIRRLVVTAKNEAAQKYNTLDCFWLRPRNDVHTVRNGRHHTHPSLKNRTFVTLSERAPAYGAATRPATVIANFAPQSPVYSTQQGIPCRVKNDEHYQLLIVKNHTCQYPSKYFLKTNIQFRKTEND